MISCPKVTVIIPVYNVEKYLHRCVDSVLTQTYRNIEVILVDDGSSDGSSAICDEYARQDGRVIVIHKKNGGLSSARNAALEYPLTGSYISFVDSDDWIEPDTYEYCLRLIEKYRAECVQYEMDIAGSPLRDKVEQSESIQVYEGKDVLQYFMLRATRAPGGYSMCGGLYSKELLEGLRFREGKINEDIDYKCHVMSRCQKMLVTNQKKYNYFQSNDTLSNGGLKRRDFQLREAADLLAGMTSNETYGTIAFLGRVKQARTAFSLLCKIAYYGIGDPSIDKKSTINELTHEHRKNVGMLLKAPLPMSRKVLVVMFAINYRLTEKCIHLAKQL